MPTYEWITMSADIVLLQKSSILDHNVKAFQIWTSEFLPELFSIYIAGVIESVQSPFYQRENP